MPVPSEKRTAAALHNVLAGLSVAALLVPESIAYAGIAGVAPQHAVLASIAGICAYACIGTSRYAIVAPTSSSAAILAAAVASLTSTDASGTANYSVALVLMVGALFALAALARIGHLAAFISRPVLRGFAFGLAITIVIRQLPHIVGVSSPSSEPILLLTGLLTRLPDWNPWTLALGLAAIAGLSLVRLAPMFPAAFVVMALGIAVAAVVDLPAHGVALVGQINLAGLSFGLPHLPGQAWLRVSELALPLVVILYAESWGSIRALALRHGDEVNANRELAALGLANLCAGSVQGLPVGAGFSASSANEDAGATTKSASLVAALTVAALVFLAGDWLALLPVPVLAAVVISALAHSLNPRPLIALWRLQRDEVLALGAVLAVIALGVLHGMMLAVLLSLLAAVRRFSQSRLAVLGALPGTTDYVDTVRHPEAIEVEGILILRPQAPLFFANAEQILARARTLIEQRGTAAALVISLEETIDLDSTAIEALAELSQWMSISGRRLLLARVKDEVRELLLRAAPSSTLTPCYRSVVDAVNAGRQLPTQSKA